MKGSFLHIQADNEISGSIEDLFENALKRISLQAFDALLTCGVRDIASLLKLTA